MAQPFFTCKVTLHNQKYREGKTDKVTHVKNRQIASITFDLNEPMPEKIEDILSVSLLLDGKTTVGSIYLKDVKYFLSEDNSKRTYSYSDNNRKVGCSIVSNEGWIRQVIVETDYLGLTLLLQNINKKQ